MILPTNPFAKTNHFGVAISITSVRGMAVGRQEAVEASAEVPLSEPLSDTSTNTTTAVAAALKQLLASGQFRSPYAAVSLPEKFAYSREHVLPHVERTEIAEAIGWQIEKIFPFQKQEIYWDWKLLAYSRAESRVLVTAMQKKFLDQLKTGFEQAGIYTISFEPSASALSRLVPATKKKLIIMEVENTGTTATLVINGISTLTTTTIINHTTPPELVWQDMVNSLINLLDRLKRSETSQEPPAIILTGEKATDRLATLIGTAIRLPTQVLQVKNIQPAYHLAYVAAVSTIEPPSSELTINLLPTALQNYFRADVMHKAAQQTFKLTGLLAAATIGVNVLGLGAAMVETGNVSKMTAVEQQKPVPAGPAGLNLAQVQIQAQRFVTLFDKKITPESSLSTLLTALPEGIEITNITYDSGKQSYTISGVAKSRANILALKDALDATKAFTKVVLPLTAFENTTDYNFLLTFQVKPATP